MRRSRKIILVALLAVVVLAGSIGGVVYAQTETDDATPTKTLMARVAEKLGIEQQQLEDAFNQARQEMQDEALDNHLQRLVDDEKMTQEQADQYKAWLKSKPDVPITPGLRGPGMQRGFGGPGDRFGGRFPGWCAPQPTTPAE